VTDLMLQHICSIPVSQVVPVPSSRPGDEVFRQHCLMFRRQIQLSGLLPVTLICSLDKWRLGQPRSRSGRATENKQRYPCQNGTPPQGSFLIIVTCHFKQPEAGEF
jgi:hypothetical protein